MPSKYNVNVYECECVCVSKCMSCECCNESKQISVNSLQKLCLNMKTQILIQVEMKNNRTTITTAASLFEIQEYGKTQMSMAWQYLYPLRCIHSYIRISGIPGW